MNPTSTLEAVYKEFFKRLKDDALVFIIDRKIQTLEELNRQWFVMHQESYFKK